MPVRGSSRLTPVFLEANRRNAQRSTGPRPTRGKPAVILNDLHDCRRSRRLIAVVFGSGVVFDRGPVDGAAKLLLAPAGRGSCATACASGEHDVQSRNVIDNR
ncbi:MAG TPA: hypothetical protein VI455_08085 [Terriglobia bacterium]